MHFINVFLIILLGIFEANESHLELSICPLHRDEFGVRWICNKKTCAMPPGWAPHKDIQRKADRGLTVAQSKRLYQIASIFVPVSSRKYGFAWIYYLFLQLSSVIVFFSDFDFLVYLFWNINKKIPPHMQMQGKNHFIMYCNVVVKVSVHLLSWVYNVVFLAVCKRCRLLLSKDDISDECASYLSMPEVVIQQDQSPSVHAPTSDLEPVRIVRFE